MPLFFTKALLCSSIIIFLLLLPLSFFYNYFCYQYNYSTENLFYLMISNCSCCCWLLVRYLSWVAPNSTFVTQSHWTHLAITFESTCALLPTSTRPLHWPSALYCPFSYSIFPPSVIFHHRRRCKAVANATKWRQRPPPAPCASSTMLPVTQKSKLCV